MRKDTINRVAPKNPKGRNIEIFCNSKYRDYYIRGIVGELSHYVYDEELDETCAAVTYRDAILVLVNDRYQERIKKQRIEDEHTFGFFGNTKIDFLNDERARLEERYPRRDRERIQRFFQEHLLEERTYFAPVISLDEADIKETPYLDESIKAKKDIILLDMDLVLNKIEILSPRSKMIDCAKRIYTIPAFYFPDIRDDYAGQTTPFVNYFKGQFEFSYSDLDYDYLGIQEYYKIIEPVGSLSYEWIKRREVTAPYLRRLNRLNERMGDRTYPLTDFCYKFFDDLVDDLTTQKQIGKCRRCGGFFKLARRNKKACSLKTEGKDCGKKARDHDYYEEHKDKILAKAQERRALSKKLAVRK